MPGCAKRRARLQPPFLPTYMRSDAAISGAGCILEDTMHSKRALNQPKICNSTLANEHQGMRKALLRAAHTNWFTR